MSHPTITSSFTTIPKYGCFPPSVTIKKGISYQHQSPHWNMYPQLWSNNVVWEIAHNSLVSSPHQIGNYITSVLLHKTYLTGLFFSQNLSNCTQLVSFFGTSNFKVGKNILSNRFVTITIQISYEWLNLKIEPFKIKCKQLFLQQQGIKYKTATV